jgi:hypothetical protein
MFSRSESVIFSLVSLVIGFSRFYVVREIYGDEIFRSLVLILPFVNFLPGLLYLIIDNARTNDIDVKKYQVVNSALIIVFVAIELILLFIEFGKAYFFAILILVDALQLSDIGSSNRFRNWIMQIARSIAVASIWFSNDWCALTAVAFGAIFLRLQTFRFNEVKISLWPKAINSSAFLICITSLLRDFLLTYTTQSMIVGDKYFSFFLVFRILSSATTVMYSSMRSMLKTGLYLPQTFFLLGGIKLSAITVGVMLVLFTLLKNCYPWIFLSFWLIENIFSQLALFAKADSLQILLKVNIIAIIFGGGAFLTLNTGGLDKASWVIFSLSSAINIVFLYNFMRRAAGQRQKECVTRIGGGA